MAETGDIGPSGLIPYGARVEARHIEHYHGIDPAAWLTGLFRSVLQAAITAEGLQYLVPQVTDRIRTRDGGVDAALTVQLPSTEPRAAGIVNPGHTIYQFKWRSKREDIFRAASGELKKLKDHNALPDYYVFVTNIDLSIPEHRKVKDALRKGCKKFPVDRIVVMGASELKDRINNDPRIRVAHFDVALGLCTLETAKEAAERRYGNREYPPLFDREQEILSLKHFLDDPDARVMVVTGPQGAGKTRVVAKALSAIYERVVWAREIPRQIAGLIQVLDESFHPAVLVIDDADTYPEEVLRKALEAARLKTIVICSWATVAPGAVSLSIRPFTDSESDKLLRQVFPEISYPHRCWLYDNFGGSPGLLLQAAAALQSEVGPDPLQEPKYEAILQAYEDRMLKGLGSAAEALEPLCIFPTFRASTEPNADLRWLCEALRVDIAKVRKDFSLLKTRDLIRPVGFRDDGHFQVTPPLLARRIAQRAIVGISDHLSTLHKQLSPEGRAGLIRRVAELQDEPSVRGFLSWLFSSSGLFQDLQSVVSNVASVQALAETLPNPTNRELRRVLEQANIDDRRALLSDERKWPIGGKRVELVSAFVALVQRRETFEDGARGLLSLAEVEQVENMGGNGHATRVFTEIFNWRHPHIPKDARLRVQLLSSFAGADSPEKRCVVAKAAAFCLKTEYWLYDRQRGGVAPPEPGWRPALWGDVHGAVRPAVEVLKRLATDTEPKVRDEAISGLCDVGGIVSLGLAEEATAALEFLAGCTLDGSQRARLVEGVAYLLATVKKIVEGAEDEEWRIKLRSYIERGDQLFTQLTSSDFRSRFFHWLGPTPMRAHVRKGEHADYSEVPKQGRRLAEEVISSPSLFQEDLQDWVTDEHAQNGGYFLRSLGELDLGQRWLENLEKRLDRKRGIFALGIYVAGWFSAALTDAEVYLDRLAGRGGQWSEAAIDATWRIGGSSQGVKRVLRCVTEGGANRIALARLLALGSWHKSLSVDDFLNLVRGLRDGTSATDWALLELLHGFWLDKEEAWSRIGSVVKEILFSTAEDAQRPYDIRDWDSLAAALVEWNVDVGFELLFAHLQREEDGRGIFFPFDRSQLIEALSSKDRSRLVRQLLEASLSGPHSWYVVTDLPRLLQLETDTAIILQFAKERGLEAARLIAHSLDASQPGFWNILPQFIDQWGDDAEVCSGILLSITAIRGGYNDRAEILKPRLEVIAKLKAHRSPVVQDLAYQAEKALLRDMKD
jgi:hypothetical protein